MSKSKAPSSVRSAELRSDAVRLSAVRLEVAKTVFLVVAFGYFFALLSTVAGFGLPTSGYIQYLLYLPFVFTTLVLIYTAFVALAHRSFPRFLPLVHGVSIVLLAAFGLAAIAHLRVWPLVWSWIAPLFSIYCI